MAKKTFGEIQPWDGTSGTGAEAREVVKDNFDLVNEAIDDLILPAGEIDQKINARIVAVEGDSITLVLSQDAITKLLFTKVNKDAVKQVAGNSESDLMSQKAVTDSLDLKFDKASLESARSQSTTKAPTSKLLDDELKKVDSYLLPQFTITGLAYTNGTIGDNNVWIRTDYIPIDRSRNIVVKGEYNNASVALLYFVDQYKNFISAVASSVVSTQSEYTLLAANIPANAVYVIATTRLAYIVDSYVKINVHGCTKAIQERVSENTSEINTIKPILELDTTTTWQLANDTFPVESAYLQVGIGQYSKKMTETITLSAVQINEVKTGTNIGNYDVLYRIYKVKRTVAYIGPRQVPHIGIQPSDVLIKSGKITINNSYSSPIIELGEFVTLNVDEQIVVYLCQQTNLTTIGINGAGLADSLGNDDKTSNSVLFYLDATTPFTSAWYGSTINETTNRGRFAKALTLIKQPLYATTDYVDESVSDLKEYVDGLSAVEISLPDKINATVGDTLQLFYRGMVKAPNPYIYDILVSCSKGKQFPRYFEYFPVAGDVGTTTFKVEVKNKDGVVLGTKTCNLVTKAAVQSPASIKKILCVGDSLTSSGVWCQEASRRLIGTGGTPAGLALSNISFLGRKTGGGIGFEGTGGWTWDSYATVGRQAYKFILSGVVTPPAIDSTYTNNGVTYTVSEVNITGGTGYISATGSGAPTASGTLTRTSGAGDATLSFSSFTTDSGNPFWEADTNSLNFSQYVNNYMGGGCDAIYFLLTWNGQSPWKTDFSSMITTAKTLIDHIHTSYPSCAIKIMGIQVPSLNGGMGANYGATGTSYADTYGNVVTVLNMNKAYQDWCNDAAYSDFMEFVNVSAQFDSENNMPETDKAVNTRATKTEKIGTNGVHPSTEGYYQIGDAVFRNFVANFCQ